MKRMGMAGLAGLMAILAAGAASARNVVYTISADAVMADPAFQGQMAKGVSLYWGDRKPAGDYTTIGPFVVTEHGYRERGGTEQAACQRALALALSDVTRHAVSVGGNAAIAVVAEVEKMPFRNPAAIDCHIGHTGAAITVRASIVKAVQ